MHNTMDNDKNTIEMDYDDDCPDTNENEAQPMSESEVLSFCQNEVSRGIGGVAHGSEEVDVTLPMDYYFGRRPGLSLQAKRDPKSSQFVSLDVMDAVEATVAEIMPTFQTDEIAFYKPDSERDEEQAKTESDLVNYMFFQEADGFTILETALRDALLNRNCSAKVYWDVRKNVSYEAYENVTEMALFQLLQPQADNETIELIERIADQTEDFSIELEVETDENEIEIGVEKETYDKENNVEAEDSVEDDTQFPTSQQDVDPTYSVRLKRVTTIEKPVIDSVPPEQIVVAGDTVKPTLYDVRFVAHEKIETQSSLIEQGFDAEIVKQLEDYNTNIESTSRSRTSAEYDYFSSDGSTRHIRVYECYALLDADGDGIAERRKVVYSGGTLLSDEPFDSVAMVGGVTTTVPHKYKGLSLFDRLKDIQDAKTPVLRSIIDGTQLSSNTRVGVITGQANIDDLLTSRTGGVVRADNRDSIFELPKAEVPQSSYMFLDTMDNLRKQRGGSAIDTSTQAQKIQGDTAHAFERTMSAMELANGLRARTLGETFIKGIFVEMHNIIRENYKGELSTKLRGNWIASIPSEWKKRTHVVVSIGASNSERQRQSNAMEKIITVQAELQQKGSVMFDENKAYKAITQAVALSGVKNPEEYFTDPQSPEGQQAQQAQSQQAQQAQQQQQQLEAQMTEAQNKIAAGELMKGQAALQSQQAKIEVESMKAQLAQVKLQLETVQNDQDLQFKYAQLESDESLKLTEMELAHQKELSAQLQQNKENIQKV